MKKTNEQPIPLKDVKFYRLDNDDSLNKYEPEDYMFLTDLNFYFCEMTKLALKRTASDFQAVTLEFSNAFIKKEHIYLKSFSFINSTYLNKIGFIAILARTFEFKPKSKVYDLFQMIRLLCADFPIEVVVLSGRLAANDYETQDEDLLQSCFVQGNQFIKGFVYYDFLVEVGKMLSESPYIDTCAKRIAQKYFHTENRLWSHAPPLLIIFRILLKQSPTGEQLSKRKHLLFKPAMMETLERGPIKASTFFNSLVSDEQIEDIFKDNIVFSERELARIQKTIRMFKGEQERE